MNATRESCLELIVGTLPDMRDSCLEPYFSHYNKTASNKNMSPVIRTYFTCDKCCGATIRNCRPFGYGK